MFNKINILYLKAHAYWLSERQMNHISNPQVHSSNNYARQSVCVGSKSLMQLDLVFVRFRYDDCLFYLFINESIDHL
jgi:hypothetical protein